MKDKFIPIFSVVLFIGVIVVAILVSQGNQKKTPLPTPTSNVNIENPQKSPEENTKVKDLIIEDITIGTGTEAVAGKVVTVNYLGTLTNGTKFDSSYDRNQPFSFNLGAGEVIKGWDMGVSGMKVGGKRKLTIPSDLAYGDFGAGGIIGPGATLVFEVELLDVE